MKGLALSEQYFTEVGLPMLQKKFPSHIDKIAAGLVGDGSECFGFDDEISQDHDWGPAFCVWLPKADYDTFGNALQIEVSKLPKAFAGYQARQDSDWGSGRTGVFEITSFFKQFIGFDHVPATLLEWRVIPESYLAAATNGKVFRDPLGDFTRFRNGLNTFYPEDIRRKKIAARCMSIAQSGQYNHLRCVQRKEWVASHLNDAKFISDVISAIYLLNKAYKPFYKWMHRGMKKLPILGDTIHGLLGDLVDINGLAARSVEMNRKKYGIMAQICDHIIQELRAQDLSSSGSMFLLDHGPVLQSRIEDPQIRDMNVWSE